MISIIIPNFNKGDFILKTLISVNEQTFSDWECIIVDDNSTDNSVEIIKSFVKNKNINILGWILFIISAIGFIISSIGSFWSMFGSIFFLIACLVFLIPFLRNDK